MLVRHISHTPYNQGASYGYKLNSVDININNGVIEFPVPYC